MTLLRRFLCWDLRTATFIGYITFIVMTVFASLYRLIDIAAYQDPTFEVSQGFQWRWRSHQWQAFLASDIILLILYGAMTIFSLYMVIMVANRHFVMYQNQQSIYIYCLCVYIFIEFCFSVFEFSFYGVNTFRLSYVVFLWLYWLIKTVIFICFACVIYSRNEEMADEMAMELRFSDKKYSHSYA